MEAVVADAVVSALFHSLMDLISSTHFVKFAREENIFSEIKKWEKMLLSINASLQDAEKKQTISESVRLWLETLRDLAYDAEDIIDELETEANRRKIKEYPMAMDSSSFAKVRRILLTCCLSLNPSISKFSSRMESKIKRVSNGLEEAVAMKNNLSLLEESYGGRHERMRERLRTSSLVDECRVYGREKDKEAILELLMEDGVESIGVVSIVGMGGVGKTTLAQLVYNDVNVERFFDLKIWVCVSEEFDVARVTSTVLQAISLEACNLKDLNLLQVSLKEKLSGRKFLIVLDDVWNENYEQWDNLQKPFAAGAAGSKVLVTTRNKGVASMMATCGTYWLKELSNNDCISLFTWHALRTLDFEGHPNLKLIGEDIVRKCKGLPLAAKTVGGLLRTKTNYEEWQDILNSKMWDLPEERSNILPALMLSYHHLPFRLKRCFSYCAIFPKDYEFDKEDLILLWMAEGFLHHTEGQKQMPDIGLKCFQDLWSRSFFEQSTSNKTRYVMHDLINDLAQFVAKEVCFNLDGYKSYAIPEKLRHFSFTRQQYEISKKFEVLYRMKSLRTFVAFPIHPLPWATNSFLSNNVLQDLLPRLICLRVLSLSGYCIDELPHQLCDLIHLRHLNLSRTGIKSLPDSLGSLFNLQTLILNGCKNLLKLPQSIENLINLLVLDLRDTDNLIQMPEHIGNLKNLQILSKFIVKKGGGGDLRELKGLRHLRKELSILGLENIVDAQDALDYILKDKQSLDGLDLQCGREFIDCRNDEDEYSFLDMLQPHENLKKLRIMFYGGTKFPSWLRASSLPNIVDINLSNCRKIMYLPALGRLPLLKKLSIEGMYELKILEFFGDISPPCRPFPVLEVLMFKNMLKWENWNFCDKAYEEEVEFPSLRELMIYNCPKLSEKLPGYVPSLEKLIIKGCPKLDSVIRLPSLLELNIEDCSKWFLKNIVNLKCLPNEHEPFLGALKHLVVSKCSGLTSLWQKSTEFEHGPHFLLFLERLQIESCPKLVSCSEIGYLSMLKHLQIRDCPVLENLPSWEKHCEFSGCLLEDLEIEACPSLRGITPGKLPPTLKRLKIQSCDKLQSLPEGVMQGGDSKNTSHLENLEIIGCPSLGCFPAGKFPTSLKMLKIWDCLQLEPLSGRMLDNDASLEYIGLCNCPTLLPESLHSLMRLVELNISNCQDLIYFPESDLSLPNLRTLDICSCANLKSLPYQMQNLTSLQYLTVSDCPSLPCFPIGGLPPNLLSLEIWDCKETEPISKWNLHTLSSLRDLSIAGGTEMVSFPDEKCLLPSTLVSIYIARFPNLESLSTGLQNLTSLEELEVVNCPKLRRLPKERLPATLGRLCIRNCSLLEDQFSREKGEFWPLIAHIPCVEIEAPYI